jgi:hypothetical protein
MGQRKELDGNGCVFGFGVRESGECITRRKRNPRRISFLSLKFRRK